MEEDKALQSGNDNNFSTWLSAVLITYKSLSNDNKNILLDNLITMSEPHQLSFLSGYLSHLLYRDLISLLPREIVSAILRYLDVRQILICLQVSKSWNQCIDSLTDLWHIKAFQYGVNVQAIPAHNNSSETRINLRTKLYKAACCKAERFLCGLKRGNQYVTVRSVQTKEVLRGACLGNKFLYTANIYLNVWSLPDCHLNQIINISRNCRLLCHKDTQVFMTSFNASLESWNIDTGAKLQSFIGHTSIVTAVDVNVTEDKEFVITGSMDKSVKLWNVQNRVEHAELYMTLPNIHTSGILRVHFLPHNEKRQLRFISRDKHNFFLWTLNTATKIFKFSQTGTLDEDYEIVSHYIDLDKPDTVFISQWNHKMKCSWLASYTLHQDTRIDLNISWHLPLTGVKADILAVGSRFAVLMCTISCKDFHLFDLTTGQCLFTIVIPNHTFLVTRSMTNVRFCDRSILDGLAFDQMLHGNTVFEAVDTKGAMVFGTWNLPED